MKNLQLAMKTPTQEINYHFSFDPFCIELSLATQEQTNWVILQTVTEVMDTMLRLKDRGAAFHEELFELVAFCVLSPMATRNQLAWGIVQPVAPYLRYATPALSACLQHPRQLQSLLGNTNTGHSASTADLRDDLLYRYLLQKLYGWREQDLKDLHVSLDTRFLEVSTSQELPVLDSGILKELLRTGYHLNYLRNSLPLHLFHFEGFACIQVGQ